MNQQHTVDNFFESFSHPIWIIAIKCVIVIEVADRILSKYKVASWSFDKGFRGKENKEILQLEVPRVAIPKLGKRNKNEEEEEHSPWFKRLKSKHSAIESNITGQPLNILFC